MEKLPHTTRSDHKYRPINCFLFPITRSAWVCPAHIALHPSLLRWPFPTHTSRQSIFCLLQHSRLCQNDRQNCTFHTSTSWQAGLQPSCRLYAATQPNLEAQVKIAWGWPQQLHTGVPLSVHHLPAPSTSARTLQRTRDSQACTWSLCLFYTLCITC